MGNGPLTAAEAETLRRWVQRDQPYGQVAWVEPIVETLGLEGTVLPRGRPKQAAQQLPSLFG
jgi:hypothetical protein